MLHRWILTTLALGLGMMLAACQPEESGPRPPVIEITAPSPTAPGVTPTAVAAESPVRGPVSTPAAPQTDLFQGLAYVDMVTVLVDPATGAATLRVTGNLADGCTQLADSEQNLEDGQLRVTLPTTRDANLLCTQALVPFDTVLAVVDLPDAPKTLAALSDGTLTVSVNGVIAVSTPAFSTDADGCPVETAALRLYRSGFAPFCFLYPADYQIAELTPNIISVTAPQRLDGSAELVTLVVIFNQVGAIDLAQVEEAMRATLPAIDGYVTIQGAIAGYPAHFMELSTGESSDHQAYFVASDTIYTLTVQPIDPIALPDSSAAAEALWRTVVDSFALATATE